MGYRNQITFALDETATKDMETAMETNEDLKSLVMEDFDAIIVDGCIGGSHEEIKWNDVMDDAVIAFEKVLSDTKGDFVFIRLGEDHDDTEIRGTFNNNPFNVGFYRAIEFDRPEKE